jgi:type IV secretory pathway TrbL component
MTTAIRTTLRLACLGVAATAVLAACSSGSDAASSASGAAASGSVAASGAATTAPTVGTVVNSPSPTSAAGQACAAYFALDLLNSDYASGNSSATEQQMKADFTRLLTDVVKQGRQAAADGTADDKILKNAVRMRAEVKDLKKKQMLRDMPADVQAKFALQSLRVQRSCDRAGYPLPAENVSARTSAGLAAGG